MSAENRPIAYPSPIWNQNYYVQSIREKEFIAILWEVSKQFHTKLFPKMEFLMFSGNDPRNWIRSYKKYFELHQISDQQEVEIAAMLRQQERSQDLRAQMLSPILSLTEACLMSTFVSGHKRELGPIIKMPHPNSLSLAYEQDKLKESNEELGVKLYTGAGEIGHAAHALSGENMHETVNIQQKIGEQAYLDLKPYKQRIKTARRSIELTNDKYLPFMIVEQIGQVKTPGGPNDVPSPQQELLAFSPTGEVRCPSSQPEDISGRRMVK